MNVTTLYAPPQQPSSQMVITDNFVFLHPPKTGGSFVTDALMHLYQARWSLFTHARLAFSGEVRFTNDLGTLILHANKHGGCAEIPVPHQHKYLLSSIRNPFDYYVSQYEFGWWKRKEWHRLYKKLPDFAQRYKDFPNISFTQFMDLMCAAFNPVPHQEWNNLAALGRNTIEFLQRYYRNWEALLPKLSQKEVQDPSIQKAAYPVQFIFTHRLNQQLYEYLHTSGYPADRIDFIQSKQKVLPQGKGRSDKQKWQLYYTPETLELVRQKDWFLFDLFPEFEKAIL